VRPARTWLFVPGHQQGRITKALGLGVDAVILDLEDGVPPSEKETARRSIASAVADTGPGPGRFVRLQAPGGASLAEDLAAGVGRGTAGVCVPKVRLPDEVAALETPLREAERAAGRQAGSVRLLILIETASAVVHAVSIAAASPRSVGLMFGAEDFAVELGMWDGGTAEEFVYARSAIAVAAASAGLEAVDRVFPDIHDAEGLRRDAQRGRALGFTGKAIIHPAQIEGVRSAFRRTAAEITAAQRIVDAWEAAGGGAVAVEGRMVDAPIVERARRLLAVAEEEER
jgi:citrate lyase subunit beta/citryl-CoA lyase